MEVYIKRAACPRPLLVAMMISYPTWVVSYGEVMFPVVDFKAFLHIVWDAHHDLSRGPDGWVVWVRFVVRVGDHRYFVHREEEGLRYGMVD